MKKESMNLKRTKDRYMGGFGGRKGKGQIIIFSKTK